ncbi:MAG: DUF3341 domain-containing protein [Planctomycetota bacterium]
MSTTDDNPTLETADVELRRQTSPLSTPDSLDYSIDSSLDQEREETVGIFGEYDTVDGVVAAAKAVREAGITKFDVHTPFPIHGIDDVIGIKPTILPWIVLGAGLSGMAGGFFLTMYTQGAFGSFDSLLSLAPYEYLISGKPLNSLPAYIPVIFETTILAAAFTAGLGMLLLNGLPMLYNPLFKHERFRRVTDDRFFVVIDAKDKKFDQARDILEDSSPLAIEVVKD